MQKSLSTPTPRLMMQFVALVLLSALALSPAAATQPDTLGAAGAENIATFSVCAYDPSTGEVGVAVQSRFFAVGSVVPWCRAGVGAVATQAYGNPTYGPRGLDLMAQGVPPSAFLPELLGLDELASQRQIGMVMVAQPPIAKAPPNPAAEEETATEENMTLEELGSDTVLDRKSRFDPKNMPPKIRSIFEKKDAGAPLSLTEEDAMNEYLLGYPLPPQLFGPDTPDMPSGVKQFGIVNSGLGQGMTYTGADCMDWAGGKTGITPDGVIYCVQGNILAGQAVVDAMAAALDITCDDDYKLSTPTIARYDWDPELHIAEAVLIRNDLAGRLLFALAEGQAAGGDSRGMQSAALKVCQAGAGYGGYNDVKYDLRVDDSPNPFVELARILNLARPIVIGNEAYNKLNSGDAEGAISLFGMLVNLNPRDANAHYNLACGLSRTGKLPEALVELAAAIALDPKLASAAVGDPDLIPLREMDEFKKLVAVPAPESASK